MAALPACVFARKQVANIGKLFGLLVGWERVKVFA